TLRAIEEAENALAAYREEQQRLVKLTEAARESARAASIARIRYREGAVDFLALLDAERTELQAHDAVAQAEAAVFTSVVAVYKAFGGVPEREPQGHGHSAAPARSSPIADPGGSLAAAPDSGA